MNTMRTAEPREDYMVFKSKFYYELCTTQIKNVGYNTKLEKTKTLWRWETGNNKTCFACVFMSCN